MSKIRVVTVFIPEPLLLASRQVKEGNHILNESLSCPEGLRDKVQGCPFGSLGESEG